MWNVKPAVASMVLLLTLAPAPGLAEDDTGPFRELVFSPQLLMAHQRKIGLTRDQRETVIREMQQARSELLPVEFEMTEAAADLMDLLDGPRVDEEAALAAAGRVLELERQMKSRRMVLLIRIKNLLTEEQQEQLRAIRDGE